MFKRVYQVVLGVYTVLLVSRAVGIAVSEINEFASFKLGTWVVVVVQNTGESVSSFLSSIF